MLLFLEIYSTVVCVLRALCVRGSAQLLRSDLIEGNTKCRPLEKLPEMNFAAGVYLSEPPCYTLCTYIYTNTCTYSHREGGSVEPKRRGEGQQWRVQIKKLGLKYQHNLKGQCHEIFCFWFFS